MAHSAEVERRGGREKGEDLRFRWAGRKSVSPGYLGGARARAHGACSFRPSFLPSRPCASRGAAENGCSRERADAGDASGRAKVRKKAFLSRSWYGSVESRVLEGGLNKRCDGC